VLPTLLLALAPGQFVESSDFPRDKQQAALEATANIFQPATRNEGTAVIVKHRDGRIVLLTAAHNVPVNGGDDMTLELFTAKSYPKVHVQIEHATVRARMPNEDIAVVEAPLADAPGVVRICPKNQLPKVERFSFPALTVGCDDVMAMPKAQVDSVIGKKIPIRPDSQGALFWETAKPQALGRSGGPLLDKRGYLIGVCSGVQNGRGYYTYINDIYRALDSKGYSWLVE